MINDRCLNWPEELILSNLEEDPENWKGFCSPGTICFQQRIKVSDEVSLRLISFKPEVETYKTPILFMPGLVSVMLSFKNCILELNKHFVVHYLETREKPSSIVGNKGKFDIESIGNDIVEVTSLLRLKNENYILIGASLCGTAIVHCFPKFKNKPLCIGLIEPNAIFPYPKWGVMLIKFIIQFQKNNTDRIFLANNMTLADRVLKSGALWYMKKFRMNTRDDYEMFEISSRAMASADPYRLRRTVIEISSYTIWDYLENVDTPVFMVGASSDTFHRHADIKKMSSAFEKCTYVDLVDHKRTYGKAFAKKFMEYLDDLLSKENTLS